MDIFDELEAELKVGVSDDILDELEAELKVEVSDEDQQKFRILNRMKEMQATQIDSEDLLGVLGVMGDFLQGKRKTYTETQMMGIILDESGEFYQEYYDRLQEIADNYTSEYVDEFTEGRTSDYYELTEEEENNFMEFQGDAVRRDHDEFLAEKYKKHIKGKSLTEKELIKIIKDKVYG